MDAGRSGPGGLAFVERYRHGIMTAPSRYRLGTLTPMGEQNCYELLTFGHQIRGQEYALLAALVRGHPLWPLSTL